MGEFNVLNHSLVPKHEILSESDKEKLLKKYNITLKELPFIFYNDPAIKHLKPKAGDIIKITRASPTAGQTIYYRGVVSSE